MINDDPGAHSPLGLKDLFRHQMNEYDSSCCLPRNVSHIYNFREPGVFDGYKYKCPFCPSEIYRFFDPSEPKTRRAILLDLMQSRDIHFAEWHDNKLKIAKDFIVNPIILEWPQKGEFPLGILWTQGKKFVWNCPACPHRIFKGVFDREPWGEPLAWMMFHASIHYLSEHFF